MRALLLVFAASAIASCAGLPPASDARRPVENFATTEDGVRLYYRSIGEGDDVVLAPFALYHGSSLDALTDGRRIVSYDPRGRGRSAPASSLKTD